MRCVLHIYNRFSTYPHPAQPESALILHPRDASSAVKTTDVGYKQRKFVMSTI